MCYLCKKKNHQNMRILQISDIHWHLCHVWNEEFGGMKKGFSIDMKNYKEEGNHIDYIFICGDIANKGQPDEFNSASEYINRICDDVGCSVENVFVVPGNHDLDREAGDKGFRSIISGALSFDMQNNTYLDDVILKRKDYAQTMYAPFEAYNEFAKKYLCREPLMDKVLTSKDNLEVADSDNMFFYEPLEFDGDIKVSITCVNTALNCDSSDFNGENAGHKQMLPKRAYFKEDSGKQELRIIMGHHPLEFLTSEKEVEGYLNTHYQIQLFGHVHLQKVVGDNYVRVTSGAFNPPRSQEKPDEYLPIFNIIEITQINDNTIKVTGESHKWNTKEFQKYDEGCFDKEITIERDVNRWQTKMGKDKEFSHRRVKYKYIRRDDRKSFFNKISGIDFKPDCNKSDYDQALDFIAEVERMGKLYELWELMK